jgi:hypothetical protein
LPSATQRGKSLLLPTDDRSQDGNDLIGTHRIRM